MSEWIQKPLGKLAQNKSRPFNFKGKNHVIFINTGDVMEGKFLHKTYSNPSLLPGQAKKAIKPGDILYSEIRPGNKRHLLIKESADEYVVSTKFMVVAPTEEILSEYLYLVLTDSVCEQEFKMIADSRSGTFPQITFDSVAYYPINFPADKKLQKKISDIISSLDDKIENNRRMNETLEGMAQAIFKSCFVDFDPVKAKVAVLEAGGSADDAYLAAMQAISGKSPQNLARLETENPEAYAELKSTAEAFPAAFTTSPLGDIPEGWEASEIGNEVDVVGGGTPSTKNLEFWEDGTIHWTTPKDMSNLSDKILVDTERKITEAGLKKISSGLLPINTVLMSSRAPVGYLAIAKVPVAINQGYIAMKCTQSLSPEYVIQWCSHNMDEIKQRASGTTFAEISKKSFNPIPVIVPSEKALKAYTQNIRSIYSKIEALIHENRSLIETRDSLLPKLLSGEISVEGLSENEE